MKNIFKFSMIAMLLLMTIASSAQRVPIKSPITGSTIGYSETDTLPTSQDIDTLVEVSASFATVRPKEEALLSELLGVRNQLNETQHLLEVSQSNNIACNEEMSVVQDQYTNVLEGMKEITEILSETSPRNYTGGIGVGYYTTEYIDVTARIFIGRSLVAASYIFNDDADIAFRVGLGQQVSSRFIITALGTFTKYNGEFEDPSYGIDVQYKVIGDVHLSVGVDTENDIRVGVGYNF